MITNSSILMFLTIKHFLKDFVTFEQEYPNNKTEFKIVATKLKSANKSDDKFANNLVTEQMMLSEKHLKMEHC